MKKVAKHFPLKNVLILLHIVLALIGFYLYLFNYQLSQTILLQKTLNKQLILAKSGSSSVENLMKNIENQLSSFTFSFSEINEDAPIDKNATRTEFVAYMDRSQLPISGIALFDEDGKLAIIENRSHVRFGEGQDFSRADFIKWSKDYFNRDKIFVSGPYIGRVGVSVGKIILIAAKPIYFGNRFRGTLAIRISVDDLRKFFITPITIDGEEDSFIVNKQGTIIAGRDQLLNKNLFTYARQKKWIQYQYFIRQFGTALKINMAQSTWTFQNPNEPPKILLAGISKIDLPNTDRDLYMIVTTPQEAVISALHPLRGYGILWLGFGVFITIISGVVVLVLKNFD